APRLGQKSLVANVAVFMKWGTKFAGSVDNKTCCGLPERCVESELGTLDTAVLDGRTHTDAPRNRARPRRGRSRKVRPSRQSRASRATRGCQSGLPQRAFFSTRCAVVWFARASVCARAAEARRRREKEIRTHKCSLRRRGAIDRAF